MTTPPDEPGTPDPTAPVSEPVSFDKPAPAEDPNNPYRFGAPEHPTPPEYAPPGYQPPAPSEQPTYPQAPPGPPYPGGYGPPGGYPPYAGGPGQPGAPGPYAGGPGQYAGGAYPYPPPPYLSQYPQPKTGNGRALAGMILGIISIVFFWLSFFDAIPAILGLVFGFLGLNESQRTGSGRGQAIAGIVCSFIGAALAIALTIFVLTRLRPCLDNYNSGSAEFNSCVRRHL